MRKPADGDHHRGGGDGVENGLHTAQLVILLQELRKFTL